MNTDHSVLPRINIGDVVSTASCNGDMYFRVVSVYKGSDGRDYARLKGLSMRLEAEALLEDLVGADPIVIADFKQQCELKNNDKIINLLRKRDEDRIFYIKRATGGKADGPV